MANVVLRSGEANPNNVKLTDGTTSGGSTVSATFATTGDSTTSFVGSAVATGVAVAAGSAAAAYAGSATATGALASVGDSTATYVGSAGATGVAVASGSASTSYVAGTTAAGAYAGTGVATTGFLGLATATSTAVWTGDSSASWVGASTGGSTIVSAAMRSEGSAFSWYTGESLTTNPVMDTSVAAIIRPSYSVRDNGIPVFTVRGWTSALVPLAGGGWRFITQAAVLHDPNPTQWTLVNLDTGTYTTWEPPVDVMNDKLASTSTARTHQALTYKNQLRASNGRIFFPETQNNFAYYDPADETMHQLPFVVDLPNTTVIGGLHVQTDAVFYSNVFAQNGKLYSGTQSSHYVVGPAVVETDPVTLAQRVVGHVGTTHTLSLSYAYDMAADTFDGWIYVVVGQSPWELVALNIATGVQTSLHINPSTSIIKLRYLPEGIVADFATGGVDSWWCINGVLAQKYVNGYLPGSLTFTTRSVTPASNPLVLPPNIDDSGGVPQVKWQPNGSDPVNDPWTTVLYTTSNQSPANIENITAIPGGDVIGTTDQYSGIFRYSPATDSLTWYGVLNGTSQISQGARLVTPDGNLYMCGYPNGRLLRFNPNAAYVPGVNPVLVGSYTSSGVKYNYHLAYSWATNRLYASGRREREGVGSAIGYNNVGTGVFAGTNTGLQFLDPSGLAVLDGIGRVVLSGNLNGGVGQPSEAQLVIYNQALTEVDRQTVVPGMQDTGYLFTCQTGELVCGITLSGFMYVQNISKRQLVKALQLDETVEPSPFFGAKAAYQDPLAPGAPIYIVIGGNIWTVQPDSLAMEPVAPFPTSGYAPVPTVLTVNDNTIYGVTDTNLFSLFRQVPPHL